MKMFLKRVRDIFCVRAPSNNVAVFSRAQDTKEDTFSHNVSATMCPSLAKHFYVSMQDTNFNVSCVAKLGNIAAHAFKLCVGHMCPSLARALG